jgi:type VI secretion system protein ImpI
MALVLTIENAGNLPVDVPKNYSLPAKGRLDIGRGTGADWRLPDTTRFISGRHCEIRWRDETFWLYDVSTNGTFVNGSRRPLAAPHPLRSGDRVAVGIYVLKVAMEPDTVMILDRAGPSPAVAA